jgi:hypothetical protein
MMTATNIHYEYADRVRGLSAGGIGAIFQMVQRIELVKEIDRDLHLLKRHLPYHESDHVLNIAFNILAGGQRIEHLELRCNDEVYLDALGAKRIPDPTTAGDFCRSFAEPDVIALMNRCNCPAQERRSGVDCARGRSGQQLGIHGDGVVGVEPQGLECPANTGRSSVSGQTLGRETDAFENGIHDVLRGLHPDAVSDRAERTTIDLPVPVVEPMARSFPPTGRAAA